MPTQQNLEADMKNSWLSSTRKQIWKFRFMMCWRSIVIVLLFMFIATWMFSPLFLGGYFADSPYLSRSSFKYLGYLCYPMLILNFTLADSKDNMACLALKKITENWHTLDFLIQQGKNAIWLLKKMRSDKLSIFEMDELRACLEDIGVECDEISILTYEYDKLK